MLVCHIFPMSDCIVLQVYSRNCYENTVHEYLRCLHFTVFTKKNYYPIFMKKTKEVFSLNNQRRLKFQTRRAFCNQVTLNSTFYNYTKHCIRGGSRAAVTSKMERVVIIVNGCCSSPRSVSVYNFLHHKKILGKYFNTLLKLNLSLKL